MVKLAGPRVCAHELLSAADRSRPVARSHRPGLPAKTFAAKSRRSPGRLQKERQMPSSVAAKPGQMREGVTLAVRLAELIQTSEPTAES